METFRFPCGCEFEVVGPPPQEGTLPLLRFDAYNINPNCAATWRLLGQGLNKGVFQLESCLGKQWVKQLKPREMDHLGALGALLRPGCLKAEMEPGVSMTKLYCMRLNGDAPVTSIHPALDPILSRTYNVLTYQEQMMLIARDIAGFDLREVDRLRKAVGKKDEKELAQVGELFLVKAKEQAIIPYELAETVWGWIKKSGRYAFNSAHSLSYGVLGYITAFIKTHFPIQFFTMWLRYAQEKQDPQAEKNELVNEAKLMDVEVLPPDMRALKKHFWTDGKKVYFGLTDIKGIGKAQMEKLDEAVQELPKPIAEMSWLEILLYFSHNLGAAAMERYICVGAFDYLCPGRRIRSLEEFRTWVSLTKAEQNWVRNRYAENSGLTFLELLKLLAQPKKNMSGPSGGCFREDRRQTVLSRIKLLEHPPTPLDDYPNRIANDETELLGVAITCTELDGLDPRDVNTTCKEFLGGHNGHFGSIVLGVKIEDVREHRVKKGKNAGRDMGYLSVSDSSAAMGEITVFPEEWTKLREILTQGNCVLLRGERDKKNGGLIVKKASVMS